jgi:hypothetical protein
MNNSQLNYLIEKERINDLARAAERYRLAQQGTRLDSRPRSLMALVLLPFRRRDTRGASVEDPRAAGRAHRSSLDREGRRLTINSNTSATCHSADNITASPRSS